MSKRILAVAVLGLAFFAGSASASTWNYSGTITDCNAAICSLVPITTGAPVVGEITITPDGNGDFTIDNTFMDFSFLVGGVIPVEFPAGDPLTGVYLSGSGTTDGPTGDFLTGSLLGSFVGGTLGGLLATVSIDLITGDFLVTVGGGAVFVASVEGSFTQKPVPVPAAVWLMGSAILGLAGLRRRKTA